MPVKILSAQEIKDWDRFTIENEPVSSIDLMERAASKCREWIEHHFQHHHAFSLFCGRGNNGGDGLALARMLWHKGHTVSVYLLPGGHHGSPDFEINLQRLQAIPSIPVREAEGTFPSIPSGDILIDALFGTGLHRPLEGPAASLVRHINVLPNTTISIDLPSGLYADRSSKGQAVVEADHTLSFQCYKLALLLAENATFIGAVHLLDIGLHPRFPGLEKADMQMTTAALVRKIFKPRGAFAHKGSFGHALLLAGSYGKMGAAILAAKACLHSGIGLLSCGLPKCGYAIMQTAVPEAMVITDENEWVLTQLPDNMDKYAAIGMGPGIGTDGATQKLLSFLVRRYQNPFVIDANGLNCLSMQKDLLHQLSPKTVLTPHPKEFDRLFGEQENDFERLNTAREKAKALGISIVLKGHHTAIALPSGKTFFNSTGNAGMAKGGSGDVLTGMLTALVAQYGIEQALVLGVYLHGLAGDKAARACSQEAMTATDMIGCIGKCFLSLSSI